MTEPETLRVFVNGNAISVPHGATIVDAVRVFDAAAADELVAGTRAVTDSRGLPAELRANVTGGAVLRLVSARALRSEEDAG